MVTPTIRRVIHESLLIHTCIGLQLHAGANQTAIQSNVTSNPNRNPNQVNVNIGDLVLERLLARN